MAYPPQVCFLGAKTQQKPPLSMQRGPCEITIILFLLEAALLSELGGMNYSALARVGTSLSPLYPLSPAPDSPFQFFGPDLGLLFHNPKTSGWGAPQPRPAPTPSVTPISIT